MLVNLLVRASEQQDGRTLVSEEVHGMELPFQAEPLPLEL